MHEPHEPHVTYEDMTSAESEKLRADIETQKQEGKWTSTVEYRKLGPTFAHVLETAEQRKTPLYTWRQPATRMEGDLSYRLPIRLVETTEGEALQELDRFLSAILKKAIEVEHGKTSYTKEKPEEMREQARNIIGTVERFRTQLTFIGEKEYDEACHGIAQEILKMLAQGKEVFLYSYQKSASPAFVETKVMEALEEKAGLKPELLEHLHFGMNTQEIAQTVAHLLPDQVRIASVDDMIISGIKIRNSYHPANTLVKQYGWNPEDANRVTRVFALAAPEHDPLHEELPFTASIGEATSFSPHLFAYYKMRGNVHDVSVTSIHAHADYGFETTLTEFMNFFRKHAGERSFIYEHFAGESLQMPALYNFIKSYNDPSNNWQIRTREDKGAGKGYEEIFQKAKDRYAAYQKQREYYLKQYP